MSSVFSETVPFVIPREAAGLILELVMDRICSDAPTQMDITLVLFQNDLTPTESTVFADITVADFSGYSPILLNAAGDCAGFVQGPATGGDGEWRIFLDQQEFLATAATVPNSIFGAAMVDLVGSRILGIARFPDGPLTVDESGDVIKVAGPLILLPQI